MSSNLSTLVGSITQAQVDDILSRLSPYPADLLKHCLETKGLNDITPEQIPHNFAKVFSLIEATSSDSIKGKSALDFGCGLGVFEAQAFKLGLQAIGFDVFEEYGGKSAMISECVFRAYGIPSEYRENVIIQQDILCVPKKYYNCADISISLGVIEHVYGRKKRDAVLTSMINVLRPGGVCIVFCAPNKYFPFDLHHYGPRFPFLHCLPTQLRRIYLRFLAEKTQNKDPEWLSGVTVSEIKRAIRSISPDAEIVQAFPLLVKTAVTRPWLRNRLVSWLVTKLAEMLTLFRIEPIIVIVARKGRGP